MDDDKSKCLQSNEEIIDELTRGIEESAVIRENLPINDDNKSVINNDRRHNNECGEKRDSISSTTIPNDQDKDDDEATESTIPDVPDDFVDEEALKDREISLTDDQREELRKEAETLKNEGNELFKNGEYKKAMEIYTQGLQTCPLSFDKDRSILYANRGAAKIKYMVDKESAISDCTKAVELNPSYLKAYLRRAQLYEETEKFDEALEDFKKILTFDPSHAESNHALRRLPPLIAERNEKLKTEMMGKLKDLGNLVLRPFGLSTDNFELKQDPSSGGYSVNFNQNPR